MSFWTQIHDSRNIRLQEGIKGSEPFLKKYLPGILKLDVQNDPFYEKVGSIWETLPDGE